MAKMVGKNLYVIFDGVVMAGSGIELYKSFDFDFAQAVADSTAGDADWDTHIATRRSAKANLKLLYNGAAGSLVEAKLAVGTVGTLIWGENGTSAGQPKGGFLATVTAYKRSIPHDDVVSVDVAFTLNGDPAFNPNTALWP